MAIAPPQLDLGPDPWVVMPATWETYLRLAGERGERARPRYTFLDGRLTAVSPGHLHESLKTRLSWMIDEILLALGIDFHASGQVTLLRAEDSREGTEPDASYYVSNVERAAGATRLVMGRDPAPDLVVEIVVSHDPTDALEAYRRFGVREVWIAGNEGLDFRAAGPDGIYQATPVSTVLPDVTSEDLAGWLHRREGPGEARVRREFRAWVERLFA